MTTRPSSAKGRMMADFTEDFTTPDDIWPNLFVGLLAPVFLLLALFVALGRLTNWLGCKIAGPCWSRQWKRKDLQQGPVIP